MLITTHLRFLMKRLKPFNTLELKQEIKIVMFKTDNNIKNTQLNELIVRLLVRLIHKL